IRQQLEGDHCPLHARVETVRGRFHHSATWRQTHLVAVVGKKCEAVQIGQAEKIGDAKSRPKGNTYPERCTERSTIERGSMAHRVFRQLQHSGDTSGGSLCGVQKSKTGKKRVSPF